MKYTDEEIKNKFSNINFDKTGSKKQAIFTKVTEKYAGRSYNMRKRYLYIFAVTAAVVLAFPAFRSLFYEKHSPSRCDYCMELYPVDDSEVKHINSNSYEAEVMPPNIYYTQDIEANDSISALRSSASMSWPKALHEVDDGTYSRQNMQFAKQTKSYNENAFKKASVEPLSTFSADVDTASYNMLKKQINYGSKIQKEGVRIEALINNFSYAYPAPNGAEPLGINMEYSDSPWNKGNKLVKIGIKAKELNKAQLPQSNIVFLIDVSGSMTDNTRLPLVKKSVKMLLNQLSDEDLISIVTYASGVEVKLDGAKAKDKADIIKVIDSLTAGGYTSGEEGLKKAYEIAKKNYIHKGNNRIVIASDGDFNAGNSTAEAFEEQVSAAKQSGVFISVLGYGIGNYRDDLMETIADKGNGNYAYINDLQAAEKALVREFGGTMFTVAKDVKFQVEFNPANVEDYRLIGYEKRALNNEDFNDDTKDAGEVGSGHNVTVFYEIRTKGSPEAANIDKLKYTDAKYQNTDELLTVKIRYKDPDGDESKLISKTLKANEYIPFDKASDDFRFASAAAAFGQIVKDSQFKGDITPQKIADIALAAKGIDDSGDRAEFVKLIRTYAAAPAPQESFKEPAKNSGYDSQYDDPASYTY